MGKQQKLLIVGLLALLICIVSAVMASNMSASDADGRPNWDSFGNSIWITILVTVPAFCVFAVSVAKATVGIVHSGKK